MSEPVNQKKCIELLEKLHERATDYDKYAYGLPIIDCDDTVTADLIRIVQEWFTAIERTEGE